MAWLGLRWLSVAFECHDSVSLVVLCLSGLKRYYGLALKKCFNYFIVGALLGSESHFLDDSSKMTLVSPLVKNLFSLTPI